MHILGMSYEIGDVTEELVETWIEIMKMELEAVKAPTELIKLPETFKKDSKWYTWKESVTIHLNS